jgi:hypothetical protein
VNFRGTIWGTKIEEKEKALTELTITIENFMAGGQGLEP